MYLDFHGFREKPFNLTPDPRFVFLSKNHKEAFAHVLYGINNRVGFISLTGEVGSGKTTVLRTLLNQLNGDQYRTALIFNPCLSAPELLQNINREMGIPIGSSNNVSPLDLLNLFLLQQNADGRTVVLVIDEAQDLEPAVLEQIRLISNLETDREKLIQIVLSGQPEFMQILERKEMRQLSQRITVRYHLQPMDFQDTVSYVNYRLVAAGGEDEDIFSTKALKRIYRYSRGLPRLINAACDRALLAGYARDRARIDSRIAEMGIKDLKSNTVSYIRKKRRILIPASVMLLALFAAAIYLNWRDVISHFNPLWHKEAKEEQTERTPRIMASEEPFPALASELRKVSESESAQTAFNTLAGLWKVPPLSENVNLKQLDRMDQAARDRMLRLHRFSGNLGALLRIDYPAMIELTLPGTPGKRFVSLVGMEKDRLLIDLPMTGRKFFSSFELEKHWSGHGFLLWKDPLNLLTSLPKSRGDHIKRLQDLLREAGTFSGPLTGVYDTKTRSAIREFQSSQGIEQDGIAGDQTLLLLYRSIDRFEVPKLTGERNEPHT